MQNLLRTFFMAMACFLVFGLGSCGVFKNGDCDCPAFSQSAGEVRKQEPKQPKACGEEAFAVDSPAAVTANSL